MKRKIHQWRKRGSQAYQMDKNRMEKTMTLNWSALLRMQSDLILIRRIKDEISAEKQSKWYSQAKNRLRNTLGFINTINKNALITFKNRYMV